MRPLALAAGLIALSAASTLAKADDIVNFTVSGTSSISYSNSLYPTDPSNPIVPSIPSPPIGGTFSYDFTTNTALNENLSFSDGYIDATGGFNPVEYAKAPSVGPCLTSICDTGNLTTDGGAFSFGFTGTYVSPSLAFQEAGSYDGTITPVVTPEPSSIALFGTGVLGLAGAMRKRFKLSR